MFGVHIARFLTQEQQVQHYRNCIENPPLRFVRALVSLPIDVLRIHDTA